MGVVAVVDHVVRRAPVVGVVVLSDNVVALRGRLVRLGTRFIAVRLRGLWAPSIGGTLVGVVVGLDAGRGDAREGSDPEDERTEHHDDGARGKSTVLHCRLRS